MDIILIYIYIVTTLCSLMYLELISYIYIYINMISIPNTLDYITYYDFFYVFVQTTRSKKNIALLFFVMRTN